MGIERGGISAGVAISIGPTRGGPSLGGVRGGIEALNAAVPMGRVSAPLNEGSLALGFLENTMPLTFNKHNPVGEISNPFEAKAPSQTVSDVGSSPKVADTGFPSGAEAVDIAEKWLGISSQPQSNHYILLGDEPTSSREHNEGSQQRVMELIAKPTDLKWTRPTVLPFIYPKPALKQENQPKIQPKNGKIELSKSAPANGALTELNKISVQENAVRQNLEEEIILKEKVDEKPEVSEREEIEELKLKDVLDEEAAEQRVYEISEAIDLAQAEASKEGVEEIDGPRVLKFLRLHIGLISQIARKIRKDGSLDETLEELAARKFSSKNEAKKQSSEIVARKEPVKRGKEGKKVKEGAVERVFKYHFVKRSPQEEVISRVVKKQIQTGNTQPQVLALEPAGSNECRIEDTPLAEVFQKAIDRLNPKS